MQIAYGGSGAIAIADMVVGFLIALCPILQHYRGLLMEVSSELLILMLPYILFKFLAYKKIKFLPVLPLFAYGLYISFIHGFSIFLFAREMLLIVYFIAALNGVISFSRVIRSATAIALLAGFCMLVQTLLYYLFGFHLQLVPTSLLLESAEQWVGLAQTGRISVTGAWTAFYRPSAFFLEPSHLSLYTLPLMTLLLFSKKRIDKRKAAWLTLSIFLTTSGIGIAAASFLWIIYAALYSGKREKARQALISNLLRPRTFLYLFLLVVLLGVLYFTVGVFRSAVNRIFISSAMGGNNAIQGRTATGLRLMQMLSGISVLFGRGTSVSISSWNISGIFYTLFQYGIVGCILYYYFYVRSLFVLRRGYFWLTLMIVGLSFVTVHTFASFYRMYFILIVLSGYSRSDSRKLKHA